MSTELPRAEWRLLHSPAAPGAWNMAVDEAILEAVQRGDSPPTLRLYAWEPACLSIGYAQSVEDVDMEALTERGWELVRRPTGGRAILHVDELTYAVIAPDDEPRLRGGVLQSYKRLSQGLLRSLIMLDVPAVGVEKSRQGGGSGGEGPNPVCFEVPSDYEIMVKDRKLVGSAQARRKKVVLQHGSLPLHGDITRITEALSYENDGQREVAATRVRGMAITVEEALGRRVNWEQAVEAFGVGFGEALNIKFERGELSKKEKSGIKKWMSEKYAHPSWTQRV